MLFNFPSNTFVGDSHVVINSNGYTLHDYDVSGNVKSLVSDYSDLSGIYNATYTVVNTDIPDQICKISLNSIRNTLKPLVRTELLIECTEDGLLMFSVFHSDRLGNVVIPTGSPQSAWIGTHTFTITYDRDVMGGYFYSVVYGGSGGSNYLYLPIEPGIFNQIQWYGGIQTTESIVALNTTVTCSLTANIEYTYRNNVSVYANFLDMISQQCGIRLLDGDIEIGSPYYTSGDANVTHCLLTGVLARNYIDSVTVMYNRIFLSDYKSAISNDNRIILQVGISAATILLRFNVQFGANLQLSDITAINPAENIAGGILTITATTTNLMFVGSIGLLVRR